ncbi:DUF2341 domain-containing protein [Thermococcus indicus]|uniref:DUF2341 domain-containing protein n=1 Tax=Thermococcus indicus TaxID=2586643 RepID=A0A4Y5SLP1_9EURY|nr:DUF2341 domain-containing protein [Thermococcus indicus]QDA31786.1 DUF2341 domain-containing protein [Thermococcus indicus]
MLTRIRTASTALVLIIILGTFGLAVPGINISAQEIGAGSNYLVSPVREGRYALWTTDGRYNPYTPLGDVVHVELILGGDLPEGSEVTVVLYNSSGQRISDGTLVVPQGGLPGGTAFNVSVSQVPASWVDVSKTRVVVLSKDYASDAGKPILVALQKVGLGTYDEKYSQAMIITGSNAPLNWYTIPVGLGISDPNFNWDTVYFTNASGDCLYYWMESQGADSQGSSAWFWLNVTNIPANSQTEIYINYGGSGNPCADHNDPDKVFLLYDDFNDLSNWNSRGGVSPPSNGVLSLYPGQWIWTKRRFPAPYHVGAVVSLGPDDMTNPYDVISSIFGDIPVSLGSFFLPWILPSGEGYGEGIGTAYWFTQIPLNGETQFNVNSLQLDKNSVSWNYGISGSRYTVGRWSFVDMISLGDAIAIYQNGNSMAYYNVPPGQYGSVGLGQYSGGPLLIDYLFVRKYVNPEPAWDLGNFYYHLTFNPQPPQTTSSITLSSSKSISIASLPTIPPESPSQQISQKTLLITPYSDKWNLVGLNLTSPLIERYGQNLLEKRIRELITPPRGGP